MDAVAERGDEIRGGQNVQYQPYIGYVLFITTNKMLLQPLMFSLKFKTLRFYSCTYMLFLEL